MSMFFFIDTKMCIFIILYQIRHDFEELCNSKKVNNSRDVTPTYAATKIADRLTVHWAPLAVKIVQYTVQLLQKSNANNSSAASTTSKDKELKYKDEIETLISANHPVINDGRFIIILLNESRSR